MKSRHSLVLIHLGPELPAWLDRSIYQARLFNTCQIIVVAESIALQSSSIPSSLGIKQLSLEEIGLSSKHSVFRSFSSLDRSFRDGFWTFTTERFFVLESVMSYLSLTNVVHIENDVLLYYDLDLLVPHLRDLYSGIAATFDNDTRCVPGILYIANAGAMAPLTSFILEAVATPGRSAERLQQGALINDMTLLGAFRCRAPAAIDHLPIVPDDYPAPLQSPMRHIPAEPSCYSRHFETLGLIFDAAALGQYLGGVDPRNTHGPSVGFINESCVFDPRVVSPRLIVDACDRRVPVVETASGLHRVVNLHIHSKNLRAFLSA
jgi:hypothetical protein